MKKGGFIVIAALLAAVSAWLAYRQGQPEFVCADPLGCVDLAPGEPVRIGVIQSLTGKVATLGLDQVRGFELALTRHGGHVLGREVALATEDTGCVPEGGANAALRIVADHRTVAVFGTTCSGDAATAAKVVSQAGLAMISGNNSAPFLTAIGGRKAPQWHDGYLRTAPNEEASGPAAARFAFEHLGVRVAATIDDGDLYTRGLSQGFRDEFTRLGGRIDLAATVDKKDTDMGPVMEAVRRSKARLVFFPLFQPEGNHVLLQARATPGMEGVVLMSDGSLIDETFIRAVGDAAVGMYFVGPTPPSGPAVEALGAEYQARYGVAPPTIYYLSAFDAAAVLFEAIEKAATVDPDGTAHIGRRAVRKALYATSGHQGVSGVLTCDRFGDCAQPSFDILRLDDPAGGVDGLKANVIARSAAVRPTSSPTSQSSGDK